MKAKQSPAPSAPRTQTVSARLHRKDLDDINDICARWQLTPGSVVRTLIRLGLRNQKCCGDAEQFIAEMSLYKPEWKS